MTRFVHIADIHFGAEDERALKDAAAFCRDYGPDAVLLAGDLTQRGAKDEFRAATEWLNTLGAPVAVVPGNHDTPLLNMVDRVKRPFARYRDHTGSFIDNERIGDTFIGGLNTARGWQARRNWAEGSVDLLELQQLIGEANHARTRWSFLMCHHPFRPPNDAPMRVATRRGNRASRALADSPFDLLICGHVHVPTVTGFGEGSHRFLTVTAGTLSTRLRAHPPSFNTIETSDTGLVVTTHELRETGRKSRELASLRPRTMGRDTRA